MSIKDWGGHTFYRCKKPCPNPGACQTCDGGLAYCTTCGGFEGTLLDECPGVKLTMEQHDWNYMANGRRWKKEAAARRQQQVLDKYR